MRPDMTVGQTTGDAWSPAFVIPLRKDARMECGKTYEATIVPVSGALSMSDIDPGAVAAAVSSVTGCRATDLRVTQRECTVRWRCHDACPHVSEAMAWSVAYALAHSLSIQGVKLRAETCGLVWIQSNWLYVAGGVVAAGLGVLGAAMLRRKKP